MDIIEKIVSTINEKTKKEGFEQIDLRDTKCTPIKINEKNFHKIKSIKENNKIAFVDGGNCEILSSSNFSLQFIRVYYCIYEKNKHIKDNKYEFYIFIHSKNIGDKIFYETILFPLNDSDIFEKKLIFDSYDKTIVTGINRANISKIGSVVRRFAELLVAEKITKKLGRGDAIILDGDLDVKITGEDVYMNKLSMRVEEKKIIIAGLSKTSTLLTNKGNGICFLLECLGPKDAWIYYPVAEKLNMYFLKLHEKSNHVFRFDVLGNNGVGNLISILAQNSSDPIFLGYPYGLIKADKYARISNLEKKYLQTIFLSKMGNNLKGPLNSMNAHDILDGKNVF